MFRGATPSHVSRVFDSVRRLLDRVHYKGWAFHLQTVGNRVFFYVAFTALDTRTGEPSVQVGREWLLPEDPSAEDVIRTVFLAIKTAEEHEMRELFLFDGKALFDPHSDTY